MSKTLDNSDVREAAPFAHRLQAEALARGSRGQRAAWLDRFYTRNPLESCIEADALIDSVKILAALQKRYWDRYDLVVKCPSLRRRRSLAVALEREPIHRISR